MTFASVLAAVEHAFWAGVAASAFAILFNVPPRTLSACFASGFVGYAVRALLVATGHFGTPPATLFAAVSVTLFSTWCGRRLRAPAVVFVIPGAIPMVPGALAFRTLADMLTMLNARADAQQEAFVAAMINGTRTALVTAALATGIAVPSLLLRRNRAMM